MGERPGDQLPLARNEGLEEQDGAVIVGPGVHFSVMKNHFFMQRSENEEKG